MAEVGLFRQMRFHSRTSQFGTLSAAQEVFPDTLKQVLNRVVDRLQNESFAREWADERAAGFPRFQALTDEALSHPINAAEDGLRRLLSVRPAVRPGDH
jgi:ketol-acid reductoisomerase